MREMAMDQQSLRDEIERLQLVQQELRDELRHTVQSQDELRETHLKSTPAANQVDNMVLQDEIVPGHGKREGTTSFSE
jgi:hypothetical protein